MLRTVNERVESLKIAGQISQGDNSSERETEELYQPGRFLQEKLGRGNRACHRNAESQVCFKQTQRGQEQRDKV